MFNRKKAKKKSKRKSRAKKTKSKKAPSRKKDPKLPEPGPGRRTTLTLELQNNLVTLVQTGNYYQTACGYCQLPVSTFFLWMKRGEIELERLIKQQEKTGKHGKPLVKELIYLEFMEAIKNADAKAEVTAVMKVRQDKDWKAHMTFLERRWSKRWRRKDHHEFASDPENPVRVIVTLPNNNRGDN